MSGVYVNNFQLDILKNDQVLVFWRSKRPFLTLFPAISVFCPFSKFVLFGSFKKCFRVIFRVIDEKLPQKHVSRRQKPKFSVWPFLDLLTLNMLTENLRWYLEVSKTRSMSLYWLSSISYGSSARQIQILQIVKHFDFDLTCDLSPVTLRSTTIGFPRQILQIYRTPFQFCKSDQ